jgi:hypothetical protein
LDISGLNTTSDNKKGQKMIVSQLIRALVPLLLAAFTVGDSAESCDCFDGSMPGISASNVLSGGFWN